MAGNSFGQVFRLTTFGESHGAAIGGVIDGCPSGLLIDQDFIQQELDKRKPNNTKGSTERKEEDKVEFLSGIFEGRTTGAPIGFIIRNKNQKPKDYDDLKDVFRPSHADYVYQQKYKNRDHRGGGRSSARETVCRVVAGAIAKLFLSQHNISIQAYVSQIGTIKIENDVFDYNVQEIYKSPVRCPDPVAAKKMIDYLDRVIEQGDTVGGKVTCIVKNTPVGLGEPVFDKLHADLGKSMLSINAVKGFEIGSGFRSVEMKGSEHNDAFVSRNDTITTETNHSGGIQGGISNGQDIYFNVAFKPISSIKVLQKTVTKNKRNTEIIIGGRHDVCIVPRAVPIVEAMAAITIMDHFLRNKSYSS